MGTFTYNGRTQILATGVNINGTTVVVNCPLHNSIDHTFGVMAAYAGGAPTYSLAYRPYWSFGGTTYYGASVSLAALGTALGGNNVVAPYAPDLYGCDGIELTWIGAANNSTAYTLFAWLGEA